MSLKATFTEGSNSTTVKGLYQWDYGQTLEIESADIGSELAEVHFACPNMTEAIVHSCAFSDGVGNINIPDECLEQSNPITAWIYRINDTQGGYTAKTITLPVTARTRPGKKRDITPSVSDKYTELIAEVNASIAALENGDVVVAKATEATTAGHAISAGNASTANYATSAGNATTAGSATKATQDENGDNIADTYEKIATKKQYFKNSISKLASVTDKIVFTFASMVREISDVIGCAGTLRLFINENWYNCPFSAFLGADNKICLIVPFPFEGTEILFAVLDMTLDKNSITVSDTTTITVYSSIEYSSIAVEAVNLSEITIYYK